MSLLITIKINGRPGLILFPCFLSSGPHLRTVVSIFPTPSEDSRLRVSLPFLSLLIFQQLLGASLNQFSESCLRSCISAIFSWIICWQSIVLAPSISRFPPPSVVSRLSSEYFSEKLRSLSVFFQDNNNAYMLYLANLFYSINKACLLLIVTALFWLFLRYSYLNCLILQSLRFDISLSSVLWTSFSFDISILVCFRVLSSRSLISFTWLLLIVLSSIFFLLCSSVYINQICCTVINWEARVILETAFLMDCSLIWLSFLSSSFSLLSKNLIWACISVMDFSIWLIFFSSSATLSSLLFQNYCPWSLIFIFFLPFLLLQYHLSLNQNYFPISINSPIISARIILLNLNCRIVLMKLSILLGFLLLCLTPILAGVRIGHQELDPRLKELVPQIEETMRKGRQNIWKQIEQDEPVWNFPPWLGTFFLSEYHFELKALNITGDLPFQSQFNSSFLRDKLLKQQQADGSWMQIVDLNQKHGSLDATIFNYWFLKDIGESMDSQPMKKAKKFILDHGGIQHAQIMTKFKLAAFGVYQWVLLPYVPLFIFKNQFPFYSYAYIKDYVAQWVYPHLTGLAYLRYHKTVFPVSSVCLQQLRTSRSDHCEQHRTKNPGLSAFKNLTQDASVDNLLEEIIKLKGRRGAFGAYTISTLLNLLSFKDYSIRYGHDNPFHAYYRQNLVPSLQFVDDMYFNRRVPYEGSLDDGRYWDTILAVMGLLEAGEHAQKLSPTIEYLIKTAVQHNGGIPYGHEFQYAPDIDDTAMLLMLYGKMKNANVTTSPGISYPAEIDRTYSWIKSNQNSDGGFPAFDKDKNDDQYMIIKQIFKWTRIDKSAQIFDPSCPDIVGHILEGMGECGIIDDPVIAKAVRYLYGARKDGMWSARWGINYVYAVGAVLPGLARVGYSLDQDWVLDIVKRLQQVQQPDGGFGENSQSYNVDKYVEGATTVSMTAWGLLAYIQVAHLPIPNIQDSIRRAAEYLLTNFKDNNGQFFDRSVVGTGHRGVLNLQYPVYAYSFPLVALSRLDKLAKGQYAHKISSELTGRVNKEAGILKEESGDL